ncbi:MAG: exodeoxyribonuclease VII small subunit, partial [Candidatus Omnitrophica bacterium]|nr:exodeoxyribonuclease VII small subunit [Candidatus Omnitrophota bacterium]
MTDQPEEKSFEEVFERLNRVVAQLEAGEGTLTQRADLFEEGIRLSKICSEKLEAIE